MKLCVETCNSQFPSRTCFAIPVEIPLWEKFRITKPWIQSEKIGVKQANDLLVLANVHELVKHLSPQVRRSLEAPVKQAFELVELPEFITLTFDEPVGKSTDAA